jgi:hypothetical protein
MLKDGELLTLADCLWVQAREALQWYSDDVERACEFLLITDDNEPSSYM